MQVISEALMSLSAEEAEDAFATVYMPIVVEGHKRYEARRLAGDEYDAMQVRRNPS